MSLAAGRGLSALSLTDHDTVAGLAEAAVHARRLNIDFLPGIELSCAFPRPGSLHLLGYGVDPESPGLLELVAEQAAAREERNRLIVHRLNGLGLDVTWEDVLQQAGATAASGGTVGRPHIAAALVRKGHVLSSRQAFEKYLGGAGAAYVDTQHLTAERAIAVVRQAGGLASLAHPFQLRRRTFAQLEAMVRELAEQGLEGLETIHSGHDADAVTRLTRLADRTELLTTGGSDFHGASKPGIRLGSPAGRAVPRAFYDAIVARLQRRHTKVRTAPGRRQDTVQQARLPPDAAKGEVTAKSL